MKKNILIIIVGLIGCQSVYSQSDTLFKRINFGVSGFVGVGNVYNNIVRRTDEMFLTEYRANWLIGLYGKYNFSRKSSIELDLLYNRINSYWDYFVEFPQNVKVGGESSNRKIDYLSIPLTYQLKIHRFRVNLGAQYSILLKNRADCKIYSYSRDSILQDNTLEFTDLKKSDLSLVVFLSYKINKKFEVEARFNQGLINTRYPEYYEPLTDIYYAYHSRQFLFGLKYCIK